MGQKLTSGVSDFLKVDDPVKRKKPRSERVNNYYASQKSLTHRLGSKASEKSTDSWLISSQLLLLQQNFCQAARKCYSAYRSPAKLSFVLMLRARARSAPLSWLPALLWLHTNMQDHLQRWDPPLPCLRRSYMASQDYCHLLIRAGRAKRSAVF